MSRLSEYLKLSVLNSSWKVTLSCKLYLGESSVTHISLLHTVVMNMVLYYYSSHFTTKYPDDLLMQIQHTVVIQKYEKKKQQKNLLF